MLMKLCKCGRRVEQGQVCPCQKDRHKIYDKTSRDKQKKKYYGSSNWKKIVQTIKARANGLDEYQLSVKGIIEKGTTVHHIYTVEERPDLKNSLENLILLSARTHNMIHAEYERDAESKKAMQKILLEIRNGRGGCNCL